MDLIRFKNWQFFQRILGFDLEHHAQFFGRFVSVLQSKNPQANFISLSRVGTFFEQDAWFRKEKVQFWNKMNKIWESVHIRKDTNLDPIHLTYKIINLSAGLDKMNNYCSLFFGFDRMSEYLTDPVINALLEQEVLYIHKYRSMITLASQFHIIFLNEYAKSLWSTLSVKEKMKYFSWKLTNGFEFSPIKKWKRSRYMKNVELRNFLHFEFKTGMIPTENIWPSFNYAMENSEEEQKASKKEN